MDTNGIRVEEPLTIKPDLALRIQEELGENVFLCYQCAKCSSGCPIGRFLDWQPNQIMRAVQLGQEDLAFESETPWLCAACQTCTTRCPQGIDINAVMEFLTREAHERGHASPVPAVTAFNEAFMREVRLWGRSYEPGVMAEVKLRTREDLFADLELYLAMLKKRKVAILPKLGKPPQHVRPVPGAESAVAYYPGCSLHATAAEFDASARAVCNALDIHLVEPEGWICCGSSAAHRIDPQAATMLPMENLALIEKYGFKEVMMPCAACFNRHKAAQFHVREDPALRDTVDVQLQYSFKGSVDVHTFVQTIMGNAGPGAIRDRVKKSLADVKIVPYYGCLLTRPPDVTGAEHPENPTDMDVLLACLGTEVLDWSYKTSCCGASHFLTRPDIVLELSGNLIKGALDVGADAIVVACPLCHANLDARQMQMAVDAPVPVLYISQLMAIAFGLPAQSAALHKNLVDPRPLLSSKGLL